MSKVQVNYRGHLAALTGVPEESFQAVDVGAVLKILRERHGKDAEKAARSMLIAVNGESILLLKRYKTVLSDGDKVSFFPICAGG